MIGRHEGKPLSRPLMCHCSAGGVAPTPPADASLGERQAEKTAAATLTTVSLHQRALWQPEATGSRATPDLED